ncbi:hypothetical protein K3551_09360 [Jannaschia sp. M317]|nr:hypothetical protein K3551_09360 [Jannaschia sp. M317]
MGHEILTEDLFGGLRTLPSGRRGRPAHCWSQENENIVILALAQGYSDAEAARALGISLPTLRKYYFSTLKMRDMQRTRQELWLLARLAEQVNAGNVGAMKEMKKQMAARDRVLAERALKQSEDEAPSMPVGKKEQARRDAEQAIEDPDLTPGLWTH